MASPPGAAAADTPAFPLDRQHHPRAACEFQYLTELGWRFSPGDETSIEVAPGQPCDRANLHEALRADDLRAVWPAAAAILEDPVRVAAELAALVDHPATLCAYKFRVAEATRAAVDKLVANPDYRFFGVQAGWISFGLRGAERHGWTRIHSWGRGFRPTGSNYRAIAAFYDGPVRAECGVGRQVAQYATLAELYGPDGFDTAFSNDEIVIGTFRKLQRAPNLLLGAHAGEMLADGRARETAQLGRQGFVGLPGFIFHVYDKSKLSDLSNQAQNFVVYEVGADAALALRAHRGFEYYSERNLEVWMLAQKIERRGRRWFERLLFERDPTRRGLLSPEEQRTVARIDAILDDPFYREFLLYVHPRGVKPVAYHIARLLDRNPRTPYRIELGLHNVHTALYRRYAEHRIQTCMRSDLGD